MTDLQDLYQDEILMDLVEDPIDLYPNAKDIFFPGQFATPNRIRVER